MGGVISVCQNFLIARLRHNRTRLMALFLCSVIVTSMGMPIAVTYALTQADQQIQQPNAKPDVESQLKKHLAKHPDTTTKMKTNYPTGQPFETSKIPAAADAKLT